MERGSFEIHRKIFSDPIFFDANLLQLFFYCIGHAAWEDRKVMHNQKIISLKRGQLIRGRKSLSEDLKQKETTTWKRLLKLEKLFYLKKDVISDKSGTIITVINYDTYQIRSKSRYQPSDNPVTTQCQPSDTNKELKELKELKEENILFEKFWKKYPKKEGKKKVQDKFLKLSKETQEKCLVALDDYIKMLKNSTFNRKPMIPSRWLNEESWNNEYDIQLSADTLPDEDYKILTIESMQENK